MLEYERLASSENEGLKLEPLSPDMEEWKDGLVSVRTFYNIFHAGFCSPYIQNPSYLLIIDFRDMEEWMEIRVATSVHYSRLGDLHQDLLRHYSLVVLYDQNGSSVGNSKSPLRKTYIALRQLSLDPLCVLGGFKAMEHPPLCCLLDRPRTGSLASTALMDNLSMASEESEDPEHELERVDPVIGRVEPARRAIHWLPSMILDKVLYLGRADQAADQYVMTNLGVTHVLSTARIRPSKFRGIVYILVNKSSFSLSTLKLTTTFITDAIVGGGTVLVHGCDGFDQSAAVVAAYLMSRMACSLEDSLWFLEAARPGVRISGAWMDLLRQVEIDMFGRNITEEPAWI